MKQKTKRIIAREGLIILSLILLAVLSVYLASSLESKKHEYTSNAQEVEIAQQIKKKSSFVPDGFVLDEPASPSVETPPQGQPKIDFKPLDSPSVESGPWEKYQQASLQKEWDSALIPQGIIVMFPKDTSNDVMEKTIRRDFPYIDRVHFIVWDKKSNEKIDKYYDSEGNRKFDSFIYKINFGEIALILVLAVYPSYLLIRFIVWSIKTLKNRTGENE